MTTWRRGAALGVALLLAGCSGTPTRPAWVQGALEAYPGDRYLTGLGEGSSAVLARGRARAELARAFDALVGKESAFHAPTASGESRGMDGETMFRQVLESSTRQGLKEVRIAESWYDGKQRLHHALAVLDRRRATVRLRERVKSLDNACQAVITFSRTEKDSLRQLGFAVESVRIQQERAIRQRLLRLVDPAGIGLPARLELAKLESARDELAARIGIAVRGEGREAEMVERLLAESTATGGLRSMALPQAEYLLSGSLDLDGFIEDGLVWAEGTLELELYDRSANLRAGRAWAVKAAGEHTEAAREEAIKALQQRLQRELVPWLIGPAGESM